MKPLFYLILVGFLMSCSDVYEPQETVYLIKKGDHFAHLKTNFLQSKIRSLKSDYLKFRVRFDSTAIYHLNDGDQEDVNKIFGFSDCNDKHQENSARFGWAYNPTTGKVDIFAYAYKDGQRIVKKLDSVIIGSSTLCQIKLEYNSYTFYIQGNEMASIERGNVCNTGLYYVLFPYFGGNQPAPHDINIFIEEIPN